MTTLFDLSAADVAVTSDDWYTPRWLFTAAGITFDIDVCAPADPVMRTCPARAYLTPAEDGLMTPWGGGRVVQPAVLAARAVGRAVRGASGRDGAGSGCTVTLAGDADEGV